MSQPRRIAVTTTRTWCSEYLGRVKGWMRHCRKNIVMFSAVCGAFLVVCGLSPVAVGQAADGQAESNGTAPADKATDDFNLGLNLYRTNRPELAAETFEQFLKSYPQHPRRNLAILYYGLSLGNLEKYAESRAQLQAYLKAEPRAAEAADAEFRIAECSYYLREYKNAVPQFEAFLERHPTHKLRPWAQLFLGNCLNSLQDWPKAESVLRTLLDSTPDAQVLRDTQFGLASALESQKKSDEAISLYQQVAEDKTSAFAPRALARIGGIYFLQDKFSEAVRYYDLAETAAPPNSTLAVAAVLNSGLALYRDRRYADCIKRLEKFPAESPNAAQAGLLVGLSHRETGAIEAARTAFTSAMQVAGNTAVAADILFQRALLERQDRKNEIAAGIFLDFADRFPTDKRVPESLFNAAELRLELGEVDLAARILDRLTADFAERSAGLDEQVLKARVLAAQKQSEDALKVLEKAISAEPQPVTEPSRRRPWAIAHYYRARLAYEQQKDTQVIQSAQAIAELLQEPSNTDLRSILALASLSSLRTGNHAETIRYGQAFLTNAPDAGQKADITAAMAVAHAELGQFPLAMPVLTELVTNDPDRPQTWTAVLQCAEAALNAGEWESAARWFEFAAARTQDDEVREAGMAGVAWTRFRAKDFQQAEIDFRRLVEVFPKSPDAPQGIYMQARCAEEAQNPEQALKLYQQVVQTLAPPTAPPAGAEKEAPLQYVFDSARQAARILVRLGRLPEANSQWDQLTQLFPNALELDKILDEWAWANVDAEQFEQADQIHARLLRDFPNSVYAGQARLSLAESQMQAGQLKEAAVEFTAILENTAYGLAEKERAQFHLVDIAVADRDWKRARELTDSFLRTFPTSTLAGQIRLLEAESIVNTTPAASSVETDQVTLERARNSLAQLRSEILDGTLMPEPWHDRVWVLLAEVALASSKYDVIDQVADELEKRNPQSKFLFQMRDVEGRRWKYQSPPDFAKARESFLLVTQDAIGKGTETAARCQFQIAETYTLQNDLETARKEYLRLYLNYPYPKWRAQGLYQAANCERSLNLRDQAIRSYSDLIKEFPESEFSAEAGKRIDELKAGN